ncbi:hypothetical protein [Microbacterium sp.]|uniref:hypothetical protein n=1 Tax=Microbacterium sp. TaxID=51671 RepID=UPI002632475B|nr:hypothetical protein [Microbacterium sp.]
MARRSAGNAAGHRRGARHGRHGRLGRSEVLRPPLPPLDGRIDRFDATIGAAVEFLRGTWPELQEVRFEIGALPMHSDPGGIPRWLIDRQQRRIVLFRVPIERLLPPGHDDDMHRRIAIESAVFRACAEYVGKDPWEFGSDHD